MPASAPQTVLPKRLDASKTSECHVSFRHALCPDWKRRPQAQAVQPFCAQAEEGAGSRLALWLAAGISSLACSRRLSPLRPRCPSFGAFTWSFLACFHLWARLLPLPTLERALRHPEEAKAFPRSGYLHLTKNWFLKCRTHPFQLRSQIQEGTGFCKATPAAVGAGARSAPGIPGQHHGQRPVRGAPQPPERRPRAAAGRSPCRGHAPRSSRAKARGSV
ncbi:unnamed protein product [Rangifer tarandus platyrhynchus]|uniref:Uncharacterized protein n=2 Tax=Rangifer tarandus platyrhynchus TaxID=3082113 RepID=A0ABN8ZXK7_RANTA|nr:unnamed protein product [Rangifer tarandus platyrhynchus]CAI9711953.1 unnamed protein product [Rangifer tarandus platyrhynchus]